MRDPNRRSAVRPIATATEVRSRTSLQGRATSDAPSAGAILSAWRRRMLELGAAMDITAGVVLEGEREAADELQGMLLAFGAMFDSWLRLEQAWSRRVGPSQPATAPQRRATLEHIERLHRALQCQPPSEVVDVALAARHLVASLEDYLLPLAGHAHPAHRTAETPATPARRIPARVPPVRSGGTHTP